MITRDHFYRVSKESRTKYIRLKRMAQSLSNLQKELAKPLKLQDTPYNTIIIYIEGKNTKGICSVKP